MDAREPPALPPPPPPPGSLRLHTRLLGDLLVPGGAARAAELRKLSARAAVYATRARGEGTRRACRSAWSAYEAWCASLGREPLAGDPDTLAMYAVRCADRGLSVSSLRVHLAAIQAAHRLAGLALDLRHPRLIMVLEGIARAKGTRPRRRGGADLAQVMRQSRHRSADVALGYLRPADLWRNNPTQGIWGQSGKADRTWGSPTSSLPGTSCPQLLGTGLWTFWATTVRAGRSACGVVFQVLAASLAKVVRRQCCCVVRTRSWLIQAPGLRDRRGDQAANVSRPSSMPQQVRAC
ncbi:MAG TPA: hypothetical protein VIL69_13630 [Roseomonas sp.]|jgi:hypothetical protein